MKPRTLVFFALISILIPILVWAGGSHTTAGYTHSRTYLHSQAGDLRPPLSMKESIPLPGVGSAESLIVYNLDDGSQKLLVGENGSAIYTQIDGATGTMDWQNTIGGDPEADLNYVPAYAHGIVILGGPATTTVRGVYAETGEALVGSGQTPGGTLWEDESVGAARGRYPINTAGVAFYAGEHAVVAVDPMFGPSDLNTPVGQRGFSSAPSTAIAGTFWRLATTTAEAPLSVYGERLYYQDLAGNLNSVSTRDGSAIWTVPVGGTPNPNIIATEDYVFVNSNSSGTVGALDTETGALIWGALPGTLSETPAMALAYDNLYLFTSPGGGAGPAPAGDGSSGGVTALNASDGSMVWSAEDPDTGIDYGLIANNLVWYYNQDMGHIRVRDAFSGALVDSIPKAGVRGLSAAEEELFVLLEDSVDVYEIAYRIYFAQVADGAGQSTLLTANNLTGKEIAGSIFFFDPAGDPLSLPVGGESLSEIAFVVPPHSATTGQTDGTSAESLRGYAVVVSDGPLAGSSIFSFSDEMGEIVTEAGVANSSATGLANVYVEVRPAAGMASTVTGLEDALSTGVAVVNTAGVQNTITYHLLDVDGVEAAAIEDVMEAGAQIARFVDQIFPAETAGGFTGTLVISSDLPFTVTGLRTLSGVQLSSYSTGN